MKRILKPFLISLAVVILAATGFVAWHLWPMQHRYYTDADTIKMPQEAASVREILWQPPVELPDDFDLSDGDNEPTLSADGQLLAFVRGRAGQNADIFLRTRIREGWSEPEPLNAANTKYDELGPELSADGTSLYFYSDRIGNVGGYDLWVSHRNEEGWQPAVHLGPQVNSPFNDYHPALSNDSKTLYFASDRPKTNKDATDEEPLGDEQARDYDLYACSIGGLDVGEATLLGAVNTNANETAPAVNRYGDFLYFSSDRPGGFGGYDLYRSRRMHDAHGPAESLGPTVNTAANELDPDLSLGNYTLHFNSDRRYSQTHQTETARGYEPYFTTSREVFRKVETHQAPINWSAIWNVIGPNLLWALLALILTLLTLALYRDFRERGMSLLTRCLVASLLVHLLLMLLFNVLRVTTSLAEVVREQGKIQVALLSSAAGQEISEQVRGKLTEVEAPTPDQSDVEPPEIVNSTEPVDASVTFEAERLPLELQEQPKMNQAVEDSPAPDAEKRVSLTVEETKVVKSASSPDVAVPAETAPVRVTEPDAPPPPEFTTVEAIKASASAIATTQPAVPDTSFAVEPVRQQVTDLNERPERPDERAIRDVDISSSTVLKPTLAEVVSSALPELATPNETLPVANVDEAQPFVETADAASFRPKNAVYSESAQSSLNVMDVAAGSPLRDLKAESTLRKTNVRLVDAQPRPEPIELNSQPISSDVATVLNEIALPASVNNKVNAQAQEQSSFAAETVALDQARAHYAMASDRGAADIPKLTALQPVDWPTVDRSGSLAQTGVPSEDALPKSAPFLRSVNLENEVVLARLGEIALPESEAAGTGSKPVESASDSVRLTAANPIRAKSLGLTNGNSKPSSPLVNMPPTEHSKQDKEPGNMIDAASSAKDSATAPFSLQPENSRTGLAAVSEPLPLELGLPDEFELPAEKEEPGGAAGKILGRVTDAETDEPLPGATIRLVLPDDKTVIVTADETGRYAMIVPPVPDFFALSASLEGYVPESVNINAAELTHKSLTADFVLQPENELIIAIEDEPTVHHLGNDRFEGRINSQFQNPSEGKVFRATFHVSKEQLQRKYAFAEISLLAKGVQCPHKIRINNRLVKKRLRSSPRNGQFGKYTARFDPGWLKFGRNKISITARSCRGDLDDFEFVNIQIRLTP